MTEVFDLGDQGMLTLSFISSLPNSDFCCAGQNLSMNVL